MNDLFAPPGNPWRSVAPGLRKMRRAVLAGTMLFAFLVLAVTELLLHPPRVVMVLGVSALVLLTVFGWVLIGRNALTWGYAERDDELFIKHGALFRELIVVPYGRMQYVDITSGPLEQAYGIATVHLHTASPGTSARIPGLPKGEAARLRDRLTALGEAQAAGL